MGIYLERSADFHMAQLMPLPLTVSCLSEIQIGFTFLVPAHLIVGQHSKPIVHFVIQAPNLALHIANIFRYWATWNSLFVSAILDFKMAALHYMAASRSTFVVILFFLIRRQVYRPHL